MLEYLRVSSKICIFCKYHFVQLVLRIVLVCVFFNKIEKSQLILLKCFERWSSFTLPLESIIGHCIVNLLMLTSGKNKTANNNKSEINKTENDKTNLILLCIVHVENTKYNRVCTGSTFFFFFKFGDGVLLCIYNPL